MPGTKPVPPMWENDTPLALSLTELLIPQEQSPAATRRQTRASPAAPQETLTRAHPGLEPRPVRRVVAIEPFVGVAEVGFIADVPLLSGAHLTAAAAVPQQADPGRAAGLPPRAGARPATELSARWRCGVRGRPCLRRAAAELRRVTRAPLAS